jgi:hypothetical protein
VVSVTCGAGRVTVIVLVFAGSVVVIVTAGLVAVSICALVTGEPSAVSVTVMPDPSMIVSSTPRQAQALLYCSGLEHDFAGICVGFMIVPGDCVATARLARLL